MARYIDAEEFFEGFCIYAIGQDKNFIKAVETVLEDTPTADVVEVKHGKWIRYKENCLHNRCSICFYEHCCEPNYCPNCGARMDGKETIKNG